MERNIFLGVLAASLLAVGIAVMLPGGRSVDSDPVVPWEVRFNERNQLQVLGVTLYHTTLAQTERVFGDSSNLSLYMDDSGVLSLEAYFASVLLSGLRADIVVTLLAEDIQQMYKNGARVETTETGARKISLSSNDARRAMHLPVASLTYLPKTKLELELLEQRFGRPAEKLLLEDGLVHLLYPDRGMDIARDKDGRVVIQYVQPDEFGKLTAPLYGSVSDPAVAR